MNNRASYKAALEIYISKKIFSHEVRITKESIEDYCIANKMSDSLATYASLRLALAHLVHMLSNLGFSGRDIKTIIKRTIILILDSIEIEKK